VTGLCFCIFPIATTNDVSTLLDALNDLNNQEGTFKDLGKRAQNIETILHQHHPGDILQNGSALLPRVHVPQYWVYISASSPAFS